MNRWKAPDHVNRIAVEGHTYEVGPVEYFDPKLGKVAVALGVDVPPHLDAHMRQSGFEKLAKSSDLKAAPEKKAESEPKKADESDVAAQAAAIARQAAELKALSSEELVGWLKENKVDEEKIKNAPNKPLRLQLALDTIGWVEPKEDKDGRR